jgi:hypothetical protein
MRTVTAQIGAVAPWFDITNSYQRFWSRTHRWKNPEYFSEHLAELFPALADPDALVGGGVMRSRSAEGGAVSTRAQSP